MWISAGLQILRRDWSIVVACAMTGAAIGALVAVNTAPMYRASAQVYVTTNVGDGATLADDLNLGGVYVEESIATFLTVIPTAIVLDGVIADLDLDLDADTLAKQIDVAPGNGSSVIVISATDTSPDRAARIANAVGESFEHVVEVELGLAPEGSTSPVQVESIDRAAVPITPAKPSLLADVLLGAVLGLLASFVLIVLRVRFDTRVRTIEDVERATGMSVIGAIPPHRADAPLLLHTTGAAGERAEAFRELRTNIHYVSGNQAIPVLVFSPCDADRGAPSTVANLAISIAETGKRVALVDADLRSRRLSRLCGFESASGLSELLIGALPLSEAVQRLGGDRLYVVPAGAPAPNPLILLESAGFGRLIAELSSAFDIVLIETPPLTATADAVIVAKHAEGVVVVAASGVTTGPHLQFAIELLVRAEVPPLGAILTLAPKVHGRRKALRRSSLKPTDAMA